MRRTKADAQITRETLLDAAETVFLRDGVRHATMAEIAKQASVTRGAVYWHFEDKDDLLFALHERVRLPNDLFGTIEGSGSASVALTGLATAGDVIMVHLQECGQARNLCRILMLRCEASEGIELSASRMERADENMKAAILAQFDRAVGARMLGDGWTAEEASVLYRCALGGVIKEWFVSGCGFDLSAVFRHSVDSLFDSLVRPKGASNWRACTSPTTVRSGMSASPATALPDQIA